MYRSMKTAAKDVASAITKFKASPHPVLLQNKVERYAWGGFKFIPGLLGEKNADKKPFAELWMGAHPKAPSQAHLNGGQVGLDKLIPEDPRGFLGDRVSGQFQGSLPYLFKVLDARQMLSIQAHPTKRQAEQGFSRENASKVPLSVPHRSYKDDNHKPEVHVTLTDFWMLHGFRPLEEIAQILQEVPEFQNLMGDFPQRMLSAGENGDLHRKIIKDLYGKVMTMPQEEVDAILNPLLQRLTPSYRKGDLGKDSPDFWAAQAADQFPLPGSHRDRGIFSIYLLNLLKLEPGQGTFQDAGSLHAYLEGTTMELMANSDNVLRGGLTPKHVDVPELLKILTFESSPSEILKGDKVSETATVYRTPAKEFELTRIDISKARSHKCPAGHSPDILIVLETEKGSPVTVEWAKGNVKLARGQSIFAPAASFYELKTAGSAILYRASVPN